MSTETSSSTSSPLASFAFPRTGKRGVPQQFPRRLYEMLDSEDKLVAKSPDHPKVIAWSDAGNAFRIFDVQEFALSVLPKYFRTKKFSSFQRNLNLVGEYNPLSGTLTHTICLTITTYVCSMVSTR